MSRGHPNPHGSRVAAPTAALGWVEGLWSWRGPQKPGPHTQRAGVAGLELGAQGQGRSDGRLEAGLEL